MVMVSIVNLLFLLKEEPKAWTELYDSGVFYGWHHLRRAIDVCRRAGLVVKDRVDVFDWDSSLGRRGTQEWWAITTLGLNFLRLYDNEEHRWQLRKTNRRYRL